MTVNERLSRLEKVVERLATSTTAFVESATEFQGNVMRVLQAHQASIEAHQASIERLDAMVTRFDAWLRGQGPSNGHKKGGIE